MVIFFCYVSLSLLTKGVCSEAVEVMVVLADEGLALLGGGPM